MSAVLVCLLVIPVASAVDLYPKQQCAPVYYGQPCHPKSQDYDNGNYICDYSEYRAFHDTDGDGTLDCWDVDDDADGLSDEVEIKVYGSRASSLKSDTDGDGSMDGWDLRPLSPQGIIITLNFGTYERDGEECDCCGDWADPYFTHAAVSRLPVGVLDLVIPHNWTLEGHKDDRGDDAIGIYGSTEVTADIRQWGVGFWEAPRIRAEAIMFDHDKISPDDPIDLTPGGGTGAMELDRSLLQDTPGQVEIRGNDPCRATLKITFMEDALAQFVRPAVAHLNMPGEVVQMADLSRVQ